LELATFKKPEYNILLGQVAFIAGGWNSLSAVELYSPNGDCQHLLAPLPIPLMQYILVRFKDSILACAGIFHSDMSWFF
jgi:hypothetical protein